MGLKFSRYKADTFDIILNALEENNMDKAIVCMWTKREKVQCGECWQKEEMSEQKKSTKTPQTVHKIESFSDQILMSSESEKRFEKLQILGQHLLQKGLDLLKRRLQL